MRTKMKWLAAIGLIMVLLLSVCAATADEVTETLSVSVSSKGTPPETPDTYIIRLTAEGDFPMPEGYKIGDDGKYYYDLEIKGSEGATGTGSDSFPKITYERPDIYTYTVKQIPGETAGVQYDDSVYDVKVQVYNNADMTEFLIATAIRKRGEEEKTPIEFVNIYPVELVSKTVVKIWDDADNQDGIRPTELEATLTSSEKGTEPVIVTLKAGNKWTATVPDLPRFKENTRTEITYTWTEGEIPSTYKQTGYDLEGNVTTITNQHVPYTIDVSVEKVWDDADNQDGIRPSGKTTLRVTLLSDGKELQPKVYLKEADGWKTTVSGLPKNKKGVPIEYTWVEDNAPAGYDLTGNATGTVEGGQLTTLVNTHETAKTSATIIKVWDDADNQDGIRPSSINATLSDGTVVTLDAEHNWRATVENLPKYKNGQEIIYTWKEDSTADYSLTDTSTDGTITTITNTHTPATKDVEIRKVWVDNDNEYGRRTPVTLVLTASANQSAVATYTWVVKDEETLSHTFTVPVYYNGNELTYTVDEQTVPDGYIKTVDNSKLTELTVTNTLDPNQATVDIQITKSWVDDGNRDGIRPPNIVVKLLRNGEEVNTVTLTGAGDLWSYTLTGLPRYTDNKENVYTIAEVSVPGYTSSIQNFAITNTHTIETTSRTVIKIWNDNNNAGLDRPAELTVVLNANGNEFRTVTLNEGNDWTATASNLPVNENGRPITYSWTEPAIEHYVLSSSVTEGSVTTLTNTRVVPHRLRIIYQYIDGREAATSVERMLYPRDPYDVESPVIPGYTATLLRVQGRMPNHDVEYLVLYLPGEGLRILDDYETPLGLGNVFINIGECIE